jgi:hypothetical protein
VHRRVVVVLLTLVLVAVVAAGAWWGWRSMQSTTYEGAVSVMPAATLRATFTDWSAVRRAAEGQSLGSSSSTREVDNFVSRAYDLDLTSGSAVVDATYAMGRRYGFSAMDAAWEIFGQSREGAVVAMQFDESVDLEGVERNLRSLGYTAPENGAGSGGVWTGSVDLVAQIDATLTPVMQNLVVLPEERVVLMSDSATYASSSAETATGAADSLDEVAGVSALASVAGSPTSAVLYASDFACEALGMAAAGEEDQAVADQLIRRAGGVSPLAGVVLALQPDRSLLVAMHFESSDQAAEDLEPRVELASGEAVGQGGKFSERFRVVEARSDDEQIVMDLEPVDAEQPLLSDLAQGPVLFASC